jgi:FixJ family two-component response regulator
MVDTATKPTAPVVVIVDDDEAICAALARLVRTIGYVPRTFASGEVLLLEIDDVRPACVLTDIQMPGMNGLDLTRELLKHQPDLPIVVMTAYPSLANRDLALAAGALEYLTKPLDDRQLESWLLRVIGILFSQHARGRIQ